MQSPLNSLLQKEMDRKDFLKHIGLGLVAMAGATTIVKTLSPAFSGSNNANVGTQRPSLNLGYGASVYGGSANGK